MILNQSKQIRSKVVTAAPRNDNSDNAPDNYSDHGSRENDTRNRMQFELVENRTQILI